MEIPVLETPVLETPVLETPVLETPRLILRAPRAEDFPSWRAHMADAEVMRLLGGPQPPLSAWRNMTSVIGAWSMMGFSMFSVIEKASGQWIGRLGPWRPEGWPGPEVGWAFSRHAWGKGYATEGALRAMAFAFEDLSWTEVIHSIDPANGPSIALAHRLGSKRLGLAHIPEPNAHVVDMYGQTVQEWRARHP